MMAAEARFMVHIALAMNTSTDQSMNFAFSLASCSIFY
jgi:hypothetical protein